MKTTSDFCVSMTPKWDFNVHEAAQSSFRSAHHLFSCISGQKHGTSIELTLMTENAIAEFRKLLSLMDGPPLYSRRIRKGPLPNLININPSHLLENQSSPTTPCVNPISFSLPNTQFMQLYDLQRKPNNNFQFYQQEQHSATPHHCYSETDASVQKNSFLQFDSCITQSSSTVPSRQSLFPSSISLDGSSTGKPMIQYSLSMQSTRDDCSMFSTKMKFVGKNNVESRKRSASTGGCHCSKQRKLRIKRTIRVPAVSSKLADIPSDDFSWRKYGQKPIKGSPHPRSYYKCSSMRGCPARKHVERCLRDSTMLIVTYEGDHSHPRATFPVPDDVIQQ